MPILQSWFSLLMVDLMFKEVSQCMLTVGVKPLPLLSLTPLPPIPRFSTAFNTHPYILYLHILGYAVLLALYRSLFLSHFPQVKIWKLMVVMGPSSVNMLNTTKLYT
jgi:hypothetical protein